MEKLLETVTYLRERGIKDVDFGLILGSGLGELAEDIQESINISYREIPNFPVSTVVGHMGQLVYGKLAGKKVLVMQGRFHYYEGH
ncbi:purine nucleoside phosphorylase [Enterococcus sp. DIV0187]